MLLAHVPITQCNQRKKVKVPALRIQWHLLNPQVVLGNLHIRSLYEKIAKRHSSLVNFLSKRARSEGDCLVLAQSEMSMFCTLRKYESSHTLSKLPININRNYGNKYVMFLEELNYLFGDNWWKLLTAGYVFFWKQFPAAGYLDTS